MHTYTHTNVCTYTHTHTHTFMLIHASTHTHMYTQAMTNTIAQHPGLVKCAQIYIRASKFSDKNTICIIQGLVTFWIHNFGLVHFKIICQALTHKTQTFSNSVPAWRVGTHLTAPSECTVLAPATQLSWLSYSCNYFHQSYQAGYKDSQ
jgi:hypothetical protein